MKKIFLILISAFVLQSCGSSEGEQEVTIGNRYKLSVPSFLSESNELNDDASLQYQNIWKEFYVITIDESKEEFVEAIEGNGLSGLYNTDLEGYSQLILGFFKEGIEGAKQSKMIDTTVNSLQAKLTAFEGRVEGIDVYYLMGMYEGEKGFYQVLTWTLKEKKDEYKSQMEKIVYSLKEI